MTQVKVLHQSSPLCKVGAVLPTRAEVVVRPNEWASLSAAERYPYDYVGRVISVAPSWCEFSPADLADPRRAVALMDERDAVALRSRRLKVVGKVAADVTFDDRWGAVGARMREKYPDPESFECDEAKAVKAAEAADLAEEMRYDLESAAHRIAREEYVKALVKYDPVLGAEPPVLPEPPQPPTLAERHDVFLEQAAALMRSLPRTVAHTGAGLYKVRAAGTMATPAHLWEMDEVNPPDVGSPGGNPGTGSNVTVVGGQIGSALEFNGNNSNVNVGDVTELNAVQKFTITFRMNPDVLDVVDYLYYKSLDATHRIVIQTRGDGSIQAEVSDGLTRYGYFDYSTAISAGSWHHVAVVYDGLGAANADKLKIFVDGIEQTLSYNGPIPAATPDLTGIDFSIGANSLTFDGKIDDFRIYADALTDAQVKDLAGRGLAHWDTISAFDDNIFEYSEEFDDAAWTTNGTVVVTTDVEVAPDGETTADRLSVSVAGWNIKNQSVACADDGLRRSFSVYVKKTVGATTFPGFITQYSSGSGASGGVTLNTNTGVVTPRTGYVPDDYGCDDAGDYWRVWIAHDNDNTGNVFVMGRVFPAINADGGGLWFGGIVGEVVVWGAQLEQAASPSTYKPTRSATDTSVSLTTGGLTDGDRNGEVFVSGGNAYAVIRNGVDSILVVGDATGEAGACTVSPYTTFQSALDQLWADQGNTEFTESQFIRGFTGTYDENLEPNAALNQDEDEGWTLIIEGDPADDRANILIQPSGGTYGIHISCDHALIRHLTLDAAAVSSYAVYFNSGNASADIYDCAISGGTGLYCVLARPHLHVEGCAITTGCNRAVASLFSMLVVCNTTITCSGSVMALWATRGMDLEGVIVTGTFTSGAYLYGQDPGRGTLIRNCTIYGGTYGINIVTASLENQYRLHVFNTIVSGATYPFLSDLWPDDPGKLAIVLRNNCFDDYTAFTYGPGGATKTYAEFAALANVDAAGDLDATDPKFTNPGAGDFSLQTDSPCRGSGHGSGLTCYYSGTAADPHHPNIGAIGTADDPPAPVWTAGLSGLAATDERVGDEIALAWGAASIGGSGLSIEYGVQRRIGVGAWTTVWIGSGTSTHVCENTTSQLYQFRVGARCANYEQAWTYPTDSDTATTTVPVPPTVLSWNVSGTAVTVILSGVAGRAYRVRLMDGAGEEDDEQGRSGSGSVTLTAAGYGARYFTAWEVVDGVMSEPTGVYVVNIDDPSDADVAYYRVRTVTGLPGAPHKTATLERIKRPIFQP